MYRSLRYQVVFSLRSCHYCNRTSSSWITENVFSSNNKERAIKIMDQVHPLRRMLKGLKLNAAVCIPMCTVNNQPSILFTLRSTELKSHRGQVSFPGGKWQEGDADIISTGLREMHEEIDILPSSVEVWGKLNPIPDYTKTIAVTPVLCNIGKIELDQVKFNQSEVTSIFSIPIAVLSDPLFTRYTRFREPATPTQSSFTYTMPVFLGGAHKVWGLSAIATDECLKVVLREMYTPTVKQVLDIKASSGNSTKQPVSRS
ncbi:mitochondrial coenzyme A diphosphatase NUDT8-like [Antedon mediterranea]|uniref:mitochondrial coenzyme A diphosphatase NUDT8-like n=1 Tax=Antedon mediterranea TaxID=105859 RepID=UPI003AF7DCDF